MTAERLAAQMEQVSAVAWAGQMDSTKADGWAQNLAARSVAGWEENSAARTAPSSADSKVEWLGFEWAVGSVFAKAVSSAVC
jgi:hypothetical protein